MGRKIILPGSNAGSLWKVCLELENERKTPNYWRVLSLSVCKSYYNLFKSPLRNCGLLSREKDEVIVNLQSRLDLVEKTFYFESDDAGVSLFSLLLPFYYTISWH